SPAAPSSFAGDLVNPGKWRTATLLIDGKVLLAGGSDGGATECVLSKAELYLPAGRTWTATGSLNVAREHHGSSLLPDGRVLVMGGENCGTNDLASAELYDPAAGNWTLMSSMSIARSYIDPIVLPSGKVLVAGGYANSSVLASCELYDPV